MKRYHVQLDRQDLNGAKYAILPGDPGRVGEIATALDANAYQLAYNREYRSFLATVCGQKVLVCSTGIGGPSTSIAVEELAELGIDSFLRVGTTGAIQPKVALGDFIVTKAAVRLDGASTHYAPLNYPAVASFEFSFSLVQAMTRLQVSNYHLGITASSDTFYAGQERYDSFSGYVRRELQGSLKEWQALGVLNYEMESATLLTMGSALGLKTACLCQVIAKRDHNEQVSHESYTASCDQRNRIIAGALEIEFNRRGWLQ